MLWQVENKPIKFLGSIHRLQQASQIQPYIYNAYNEAKKVVFESDPTALPPSYGLTGTPESLLKCLGDELYGQWRKYFPDAPTDFKLWRAGTLLTSIFTENAGFLSRFGIEAMLMDRARSDRRNIDFLENGPQIEACFDSIPFHGQQAMLMKSLNLADGIKSVRQLVECWAARDMKRLQRYAAKESAILPDFWTAILVNRNRAWLPKLLHLVADNQPTLICVGILHYVGEESLLDLLKGNGVRLKRLN